MSYLDQLLCRSLESSQSILRNGKPGVYARFREQASAPADCLHQGRLCCSFKYTITPNENVVFLPFPFRILLIRGLRLEEFAVREYYVCAVRLLPCSTSCWFRV